MEKIWMKLWPDDVPKELKFPDGERPVFEYLRLHAQRTPDDIAIIFYGREITYRELDESSDRFANYLLSIGLKKGDRVGLFLMNSPQYVMAHFGIQKIGGIVCPCSPLFKELELKYAVNDAGMKALLALDLFMPIVNNVRAEVPTLEKIVVTNLNDYLPPEPTLPLIDNMKVKKQPVPGTDDFMEVLANSSAVPPAVEIDLYNDIALFEYTGGTTGLPKGAMLTHYAHIFKPWAGMKYSRIPVKMESGAKPVVMTTMPFFNIAGMNKMLGTVMLGSPNVMLTLFDPLAAIKAIDKYKVNHWYGAVPMNLAIMSHPEVKNHDLSSLKWTATTSFVVFLTEEIGKQWRELTKGGLLWEGGYGLSETHTTETLCPDPLNPRWGSQGIPGYQGEVKIVDFDDRTRELAIGEEGEIALRNPGCMKGYWNKPEETANTLIDGWVHTGDVGKFDEDGYLWWLGRRKEMIKVSGFSVFPEEVETFVNKHPAVLENAVIPVPDARKGEVVKTFITLKPEYKGKITGEEIIAWAKANMSSHKVPVYVEFRDELPKTGVKLLRRVLRDEEEAKRNSSN